MDLFPRRAASLISIAALVAACNTGGGPTTAPTGGATTAPTGGATTAPTSVATATATAAATTTGATSAPTDAPTTSPADTPAPSPTDVASPTGAASPTGLTAVYVSTGPIGVNPFLQLIQQGIERAGQECGVAVRVVESADLPTMENNLQAEIDEGTDLIVTNSFDSLQAVQRLAGENPDQKWAVVDALPENVPNARGLLFKEHEGTYLLGALFGTLAKGEHEGFPKSDVIGAVGAVDLPFIRRWLVGFEEGVKAVNPNARVESGWATGFNDPATSKELAIAQFGKGAKYIFAFAAAGNSGVFEAAKDQGFFTTGVDTDQRAVDAAHIIESMVKRTDVGVYDAVCDLAKGAFSGGPRAYGLAERGVGPAFLVLDDLDPPSTIPQPVQDQIRDLAGRIVSGEIVVTDYLAQPQPSPSP